MEGGADESWKREGRKSENGNDDEGGTTPKTEIFIVHDSIILLDHQPFRATFEANSSHRGKYPSLVTNVDFVELHNQPRVIMPKQELTNLALTRHGWCNEK